MARSTQGRQPTGKKKRTVRDRHLLYSAAVQSADADLDFFQRIFRKHRGRPLKLLREDFCGTAALACEWVRRSRDHRAIGIDLDGPTLDWCREHYLPHLGPAAQRLELRQGDVRTRTRPPVEAVAAQNFSYFVFKTRELLGDYFAHARQSLGDDGILFLDLLGGSEALLEMTERRRIPTSRSFHGVKIPAFTYIWEQAHFNPITHDFRCRIHFKLGDGSKIKNAFRYDWRLWTIPELRELLEQAGFSEVEVYVEGWDDEADDTDGIFRRRKRFDNEGAWVAYLVALA